MIDANEARKLHYATLDVRAPLYWKEFQITLNNNINSRIKNLSRYTTFDIEYGMCDYIVDKLKALKYVVIKQTADNIASYTGTMQLRIEW